MMDKGLELLSKEEFFQLIGADPSLAAPNLIWDALASHGCVIAKVRSDDRGTVYPPAIAELIDQFRNEALCRIEGNQSKAKRIWRDLYGLLTKHESREINIEWSHYLTGEIETKEFGELLRKVAAKYRTI